MRILYFQYALRPTNVSELEGACSYARTHGVTLQSFQYDLAVSERRLSCVCCDADVKKLLSFWRPDGCIVECGGNVNPFRTVDFREAPAVFLDCDPDSVGNDAVCIYSDADDIAACAARELLSLGFSDYAYLSFPVYRYWSIGRGKAFAAYVADNGKKLHQFRQDGGTLDSERLHVGLANWVKRLPRPCGVFAANDTLANAFARAVFESGFSIPQDFAVVGVDDDTHLCENTMVSLTSIAAANEYAGYLAAESLVKLTRNQKGKTRAMFGVDKLHRRASTSPLRNADVRVLKAMEFIRRHAAEGVTPVNVVKEMGCSRRLADFRFREAVGHSILDEIHSVRLDKVKELLRSSKVEVSALPDFCGYGSIADLRRVFKKRVGMTMKEYASACAEHRCHLHRALP